MESCLSSPSLGARERDEANSLAVSVWEKYEARIHVDLHVAGEAEKQGEEAVLVQSHSDLEVEQGGAAVPFQLAVEEVEGVSVASDCLLQFRYNCSF